MTVSSYYLLPPLPQGLEGLAELALDLRWSWDHTADRLWEYIDSDLWNATGENDKLDPLPYSRHYSTPAVLTTSRIGHPKAMSPLNCLFREP